MPYLCVMLTDFKSVFCVVLVSRSSLRILINHFYILCMKYFVGVPNNFNSITINLSNNLLFSFVFWSWLPSVVSHFSILVLWMIGHVYLLFQSSERPVNSLPELEMKIWIYWSESNSWIYLYIVLNKNWKIYWSEQSFAGLGPPRTSAHREDCTSSHTPFIDTDFNIYIPLQKIPFQV